MNQNDAGWLMKGMILGCLLIGTASFVTSGCGLTLGPRTETRTVVVNVGKPVQIIESAKVEARTLDTEDVIEIDVGGFVSMPKGHWDEWLSYVADLNARIAHLKHQLMQLESLLAASEGQNRH